MMSRYTKGYSGGCRHGRCPPATTSNVASRDLAVKGLLRCRHARVRGRRAVLAFITNLT